MNMLDIVIAAVLALCAAYGLWKGFVRIAAGIAGLAVSLAVALRLAAYGPSWFDGVFQSRGVAHACAFALVLVAGLILTALVAWLAHRLVRSAQISWVDRLVGTALGLSGGSLFVAGLLVSMTAFMPSGSALLRNSALLPYALVVSDVAATILPPDMAELYESRRRALGSETLLSDARPQPAQEAPRSPR